MKCGSFIFDGILARLSVAQARFCAVGQNPGHASEQAEVIGFCQFIVACLLHLSIFDIQISLSSGVVCKGMLAMQRNGQI